MTAAKVSEQVKALEDELKLAKGRAERAEAQLRYQPPFTPEQASSVAGQVYDALSGKLRLEPGRRDLMIAVNERTMGVPLTEFFEPWRTTSPSFRTVRVSW